MASVNMGSTNADNPITIDDSGSSWYARTVSRQALSDIPNEFNKTPSFDKLRFMHRKGFNEAVSANWPKEASQTVLYVGIYDNPYSDFKPKVYIFVHGPKTNHIGYFYINRDLSVQRMQLSSLVDVKIEEPFCDLADGSLSQPTVSGRIRALTLYYFLAAGYITEVGDYSHFWKDFTKACEWIANEGSRPKPNAKVRKREHNSVSASTATPIPTSKTELALGTVIPKKRNSDDESEPGPAKIKRRDYSHSINRSRDLTSRSVSPEHPIMDAQSKVVIEAQTRAQSKAIINAQIKALEQFQAPVRVDHQLQTQVASLSVELNRFKDQSKYSHNAYRGIQVQYDELVVQHGNALNDGKGLREKLSQSQLRCTQAEKRSQVLEKELERLRTKIRKVKEGLDDRTR